MDKLSNEYAFYKKNKPALKEKYDNKYIALKDNKVITSADSRQEAVKYMLDNDYILGEFLVHLVSDDSDIVHKFPSRIHF